LSMRRLLTRQRNLCTIPVTIASMSTVRLEVYIQPRASKSEVTGMHDGVIKIRIAAPAVENAANLALVEFVADQLGIAKRSVRIVSGVASRNTFHFLPKPGNARAMKSTTKERPISVSMARWRLSLLTVRGPRPAASATMAAGTITGSLKRPISRPTCCVAPKTKSAVLKAISNPSTILIPPLALSYFSKSSGAKTCRISMVSPSSAGQRCAHLTTSSLDGASTSQ
jgi:uncharacterized protein (TIGR00251 family)